MKVKVIKRYNDMVLKKIQEVGTELEVEEARAKRLVNSGVAELVKSQPEKTSKAAGKEQ